MNRKLYQELASLIVARRNCIKAGNTEWETNHTSRIESLVKDVMPSGSGFDNGTQIDLDASDGARRIVFTTSYHHMNDAGMYDGWTDHSVIVTPAFSGFDLRVTGRNRNDIKDYIGEVFANLLSEDAPAAVVA